MSKGLGALSGSREPDPQAVPALAGFDPERVCTQCRHREWGFEGRECIRPLSDRRSHVTGELIDRLSAFCWNERRAGKTLFTRRQRCGPEGRYFEQAPSAVRSAIANQEQPQ
jgi:hypothetical protein